MLNSYSLQRWLIGLSLLAAAAGFGFLFFHAAFFIYYLYWILAISLVTFAVYGLDKLKAKIPGQWRIPEKVLHGLALIGGFPGAAAGRGVFRHKTTKVIFAAVIAFAAVLHLSGWFYFGM